ncbi:hypothetical protein GCM10010448_34510 [Streptomyces glomeratus]|uniref:Uncharacterized protein n=1 Tax=Streptomyces glomeratus TaxID=284452 RepID=A0ABP6LQL4_9ACTN
MAANSRSAAGREILKLCGSGAEAQELVLAKPDELAIWNGRSSLVVTNEAPGLPQCSFGSFLPPETM